MSEDAIMDAVVVSGEATLEAIKNLPFIRKQLAVEFVIPGTEIKVKIAPVGKKVRHQMMLESLKLQVDNNSEESPVEDSIKWAKFTEEMKTSYIKACVVEPELDDEAIEAIGEFDANALDKLFERCQEVSGSLVSPVMNESRDAEDFTSAGEATMS